MLMHSHMRTAHAEELDQHTIKTPATDSDDTIVVYMCDECQRVYLTQDALYSHMQQVHNIKPPNAESRVCVSSPSSGPSGQRMVTLVHPNDEESTKKEEVITLVDSSNLQFILPDGMLNCLAEAAESEIDLEGKKDGTVVVYHDDIAPMEEEVQTCAKGAEKQLVIEEVYSVVDEAMAAAQSEVNAATNETKIKEEEPAS
jgi:hypothetical protein